MTYQVEKHLARLAKEKLKKHCTDVIGLFVYGLYYIIEKIELILMFGHRKYKLFGHRKLTNVWP